MADEPVCKRCQTPSPGNPCKGCGEDPRYATQWDRDAASGPSPMVLAVGFGVMLVLALGSACLMAAM